MTLFDENFIKDGYHDDQKEILKKRLGIELDLAATPKMGELAGRNDHQLPEMDGDSRIYQKCDGIRLFILFAIIIAGMWFFTSDNSRNLYTKWEDPMVAFKISLDEFFSLHPTAHNPDDGLMIKMIATQYVTNIGKVNKRLPVVLTLAQKPSNETLNSLEPDRRFYLFATELASLIARGCANVSASFTQKPFVLNVSEFSGAEHEQKFSIDSTLGQAYDSGDRIFILTDVEKLAPKTALIFHTLCDNANAPYPGSLYILLIKPTTCPGYVCPPSHSFLGNEDFVGEEEIRPESLISHHETEPYSTSSLEGYLAHKWSHGVGDDKVAALLSRMATHIAFIEV